MLDQTPTGDGDRASPLISGPHAFAFRDYAPILLDRGFPVIPIVTHGPEDGAGKTPGYRSPSGRATLLNRWQEFSNRVPSEVELALWLGKRSPLLSDADAAHLEALFGPPLPIPASLGIPCGGAFGVVGVDIDSEEHADALIALAVEHFGPTEFVRSRGTKRCLLVYRSNEQLESVAEIGKAAGILADGRQFVAYGMHPSGVPYEWPRLGLHEGYLDELPEIGRAKSGAFVAAVRAFASEKGLIEPAEATHHARAPQSGAEHERRPTAPLAVGLADRLLELLPNTGDWNRWTAIALWANENGATGEAFDRWSAKSPHYNARRTAKRWATAAKAGASGSKLGLGSILKWIRDAGIVLPDDLQEAIAATEISNGDRATMAGWAADLKRIEAEKAAVAPWQQTDATNRDPLTGLKLIGPAPADTRVPIDALRKRTADNIANFFLRADRFHYGRLEPVLSTADRAAATYDREFIPTALRQLSREEMGSGKSAAFVAEMAKFARRPDALGWNNIYVALNHRMARQMARDLVKAGVPHIVVVGVERACKNETLKPQVRAHAKRGLSAADICRTCPLRDVCQYFKQATPVRGMVIIVQLPHILMDHVPPLEPAEDMPTPAPVFSVTFDEGFVKGMHKLARGSFVEFQKPIVITRAASKQRVTEGDDSYRVREENRIWQQGADNASPLTIIASAGWPTTRAICGPSNLLDCARHQVLPIKRATRETNFLRRQERRPACPPFGSYLVPHKPSIV